MADICPPDAHQELPESGRTDAGVPSQRLSFYDRVASGSFCGLWEWDLVSGRLSFLGNYWQTLGYGKRLLSELADLSRLQNYIHPEDWLALLDQNRAIFNGQEEMRLPMRVIGKDGEYRWTLMEGRAHRNDDGMVTHLSGMSIDMTEQKATEELLRETEARHARILTATSDGIWEWSADSGGFHFSDRCWEHLGYYQHDDEMLDGRNRLAAWRDRIHPDDRDNFDTSMRRHLKNQGIFDIEYRIAGKDGKWRWIRARGQATYHTEELPEQAVAELPAHNTVARAVRMSGTNMDITDLKEAEERVLQAKEDAERANRAKSEFLSSMSHELRTPLNAILGYAQLFGFDANLSDNQRENVQEIRKAGDHLLQLINDVLDLAKIESGKMTLSVEPVMPIRTLNECIKLLQPLARSKSVRLWSTPQHFHDCYIQADSTRLKQALLNLISNAVKYNHQDGEVEVTFMERDTGLLRIEVKDSGPGIPRERQGEVFEPFNRLGAEGSSIEGSGVGLVITKQLVNMMGGELSFVSREGEGSRFWIDLPLVGEWTLKGHTPTASFDVAVSPTAGLVRYSTRKRILYVEDNPSNIRLMEQMLMRFPQLELLTASEAFYGVYRARTEKPDMIILDINLPGMDGFEALSVLRQDVTTRALPIIALSANAMSYDIERGREAGFDDYLTKPVELDKLLDAFNRFLHDSESSESNLAG